MSEKTANKNILIGIGLTMGIIAIATLTIGTLFYWQNANAVPLVTVYKHPSCGCCNKWVDHMEENGFEVTSVDLQDVSTIKRQFGITKNLMSCHTAIIDGYAFEGHVPASDIKRFLAKKLDKIGLSVPGMPVGSPGMEMGNRIDRYAVVSFDKKGNVEIFSQY
jgi:hypothetical protein